MFCTSPHDLGDAHKRAGAYRSAPIAIGAGTWIGTRAIVLPGVTVGPGCVIGAGSVVTGDLDAHGEYVGVPARRIRDLDPEPAAA
jgi:maltose O-acetyltransferase